MKIKRIIKLSQDSRRKVSRESGGGSRRASREDIPFL